MRCVWGSLALAVALGVGSGEAAAQAIVNSPVRFGLVGGLTQPLSDLSDNVNSGWHAGALLDLGLPLVPLGFRIDGVWHQFGTETFTDGTRQKARVIAGTLDATYSLGTAPMVRAYLIGGVGLYGTKFEQESVDLVSVTNSQTKFGVNAGLGIKVQLAGFGTFVEARWHDIFTDGKSTQMLPISVGITF